MGLFIFFPITGFTEDTEIKKNVDFIPYPPSKEDILVRYHDCDVLSKDQDIQWKSTEIHLDLGTADIFVTPLESSIVSTIECSRKSTLLITNFVFYHVFIRQSRTGFLKETAKKSSNQETGLGYTSSE
jgi:hypothetical protein